MLARIGLFWRLLDATVLPEGLLILQGRLQDGGRQFLISYSLRPSVYSLFLSLIFDFTAVKAFFEHKLRANS